MRRNVRRSVIIHIALRVHLSILSILVKSIVALIEGFHRDIFARHMVGNAASGRGDDEDGRSLRRD